MSIIERYHKIFDKEILQKSRGVIFSFSPLQDQFIYQPYSHNISADSVEKLGELMRHNLFFYSYGEEEVVQHYEKDHFSSLEQAAKYAYINRLPKRADITDGLPSEVLLDLLVQLYNPQACKLAVRTILRQNDNNEIKGYDLTYFSKDETGVSLWLGQAKLGGKAYCKTDINKDLLEKFTAEYLSKQIFFVCEKRVSLTDDTKAILEAIEEINMMSAFVFDNNLDYQIIKTVDSVVEDESKKIFVFTPERALQLIASFPDLKIDFFFFDEVYKIDEDYCNDELDDSDDEKSKKNKKTNSNPHDFLNEDRGKTFRIALYLLAKSVDEFYLAGPNLNQDRFSKGMKRFLSLNQIVVKEINFEPTLRISVNAHSSKIEEVTERI